MDFLQQLKTEARDYSARVGASPIYLPCAEEKRRAAAAVPVCPHRSPALADNLYLCDSGRPIRKVPTAECRRCGGKP